jgi:cyclase
MLRKRLIGVITVRNGIAVQSFGYSKWLPLGKPEVLAKNLDNWGVDEILVQVIDCFSNGLGPDLALLRRIGKVGLSTPLIYAGGIASWVDADKVINAAADRVCLDGLLHANPDEVERVSRHLGAQAVIGALPLSLSRTSNLLSWFDYHKRVEKVFPHWLLKFFDSGLISEALVIDWRHEGFNNAFDEALLDLLPFNSVPVIAFGGLNQQDKLRSVLARPNICAVAIGNSLNYSEHAVQRYRESLTGLPLRPAVFRTWSCP